MFHLLARKANVLCARPAAVTFIDGFVRRAISTACVRVNCSVGSDNRGAVWDFAVVENGPPLPKTSRHNVTVANFFSEPLERIGSLATFLRPTDAETSSSDTSL